MLIAVSGTLRVIVNSRGDISCIRESTRNFIQSRLYKYTDLQLGFNFQNMTIQIDDSDFNVSSYSIYIPFDTYINDNGLGGPRTVEYVLTSELRKLVPENYGGVYNLNITCDYEHATASNEDIYGNNNCANDYDYGYGYDEYQDIKPNMQKYESEPISENKLSTEKVSTTRKLFILQYEGD